MAGHASLQTLSLNEGRQPPSGLKAKPKASHCLAKSGHAPGSFHQLEDGGVPGIVLPPRVAVQRRLFYKKEKTVISIIIFY